jgi:ribokinase
MNVKGRSRNTQYATRDAYCVLRVACEVLGFGALNRDVLYRVPEILLDGETIVQSVTVTSGGSAANTCRALARWGVGTGFVGAVGDDPDGRAMLADLRDSGIDISQVRIKPGAPTGRVMGLVDPQGRRALYVEPGANDCLGQSDINMEAIAQARLMHFASFVGPAQLTLQEWLAEQLSPSATLSFAPGQIYTRLGRERLGRILRRTAVLFVNESEAQQLGGVESLCRCGCEVVVETLGSRGSRVTFAGGSFHTPAFPSAVVDTTGAGDAFAAGFLFGWLREKPPETCARWGNWTASRVIQAPGANSNLPTAEKLEVL